METSPGSFTKEEALRLLKAGQVDEAIEVLRKLAERDSEDAQIQMYLGAAYNRKGDKMRAIASFEEASRLDENPKNCYNLGQIYETVHRVDEAVRQYRMAVELDPGYSAAQQALDRLRAQFEAEHPKAKSEPPAGRPEPTQAMPAATGVPQVPATGPGPGASPCGPPVSFADRQQHKDMEVQEQQKRMMRSGLIYGVVCGAVFVEMAYFCIQWLTFGIPAMFMTAGGMALLILIVAAVGAVYGGVIGLWVGYTCGGEGAGTTAGAALGAVMGLVFGLMAHGGILAVLVILVVCVLASGLAGNIIGRMVDSSIGWD